MTEYENDRASCVLLLIVAILFLIVIFADNSTSNESNYMLRNNQAQNIHRDDEKNGIMPFIIGHITDQHLRGLLKQ